MPFWILIRFWPCSTRQVVSFRPFRFLHPRRFPLISPNWKTNTPDDLSIKCKKERKKEREERHSLSSRIGWSDQDPWSCGSIHLVSQLQETDASSSFTFTFFYTNGGPFTSNHLIDSFSFLHISLLTDFHFYCVSRFIMQFRYEGASSSSMWFSNLLIDFTHDRSKLSSHTHTHTDR